MSDEIFQFAEPYNTRIPNEQLKRIAFKEEQRLLSVILKDADSLMDIMSFGIEPGPYGHFWNSEARFLYGIIHAYYAKYSKPLTRTAIDSIMDSLSSVDGKTIDEEDKTTARMYWDKVYNMETSSDDYTLLRDNLNHRFVQWKAYEILKDGIEKVAKSSSNQGELVKELREKFIKIEHLDIDPYSLTMSIAEGMDKVTEYIKKRRDNPEQRDAILTNIQALDDIYHGLERGSYTVVTGMINGGKTTLMFNMGFNMAKAGYNVVYVSIEKKAVPIFTRLLALHALVDYNRIKVGGKSERGLSDYYYNKLLEAAKELKENIKPNFDVIQVAQGTKLSKIIAEVEKIKMFKKIDVLVVDYLGVIGAETHHPGRPDLDEARTSQRLQAYGRINNFVTITGAQLKTPSAKEIRKGSKKATAEDAHAVEVNTEDIAGSKIIIADADNALGCVLNGDQPPTKMFVFITKARDDESRRTITLDFDGKLGRVSDPQFSSGHIKEVDAIVYNEKISEDDLKSDDNLFKIADGQELETSEKVEEDDPFAETSKDILPTMPEITVEDKRNKMLEEEKELGLDTLGNSNSSNKKPKKDDPNEFDFV